MHLVHGASITRPQSVGAWWQMLAVFRLVRKTDTQLTLKGSNITAQGNALGMDRPAIAA